MRRSKYQSTKFKAWIFLALCALPLFALEPVGIAQMTAIDRLPYLKTGISINYEGSIGKRGDNADDNWWLYQDAKQEWVLLDVDGPGCIYNFVVHHFGSNPVYRFYFDGADTAAFEINHYDFGIKPPFVIPLADKFYEIVGVVRSFCPMPFRRSCRVTSSVKLFSSSDGGYGGWGHILYHSYPTADGIVTFTGKEDYSTLLSLWCNVGKDPKDTIGNLTDRGTISINAGAIAEIFDHTGAGSIASIKLCIPLNPMTWLNNLWIRIQWENEPTPAVDCPIGAFFGNELGLHPNNPNKYLMHGMTTDGSFYCYWPMPYWESAKISLVNKSSVVVSGLTFNVNHKPSTLLAYPRAEAAHFRASEYQPPLAKSPEWDSHIGTIKGSGHFVSGVVTGSQTNCEGDVRVMIDNGGTPRVESDGSESWTCYGMGYFGTSLMNPTSGYDASGNSLWSMNRSCTGDWYPFRTGLRFSVEGGNGVRGGTDIRSGVLLYYGEPDPAMRLMDSLDIGDPVSERAHGYSDSSAVPVSLNSAYEGEMDNVLVNDNGRQITGWSRFTVHIEKDNQGIMLRRRSDQNIGRQMARVYVDGIPVMERDWYFADRNPYKRWLDDEFVIPAYYTADKDSISLRIEPVSAGGLKTWNQYMYWGYSLRIPDEKTKCYVTLLDSVTRQVITTFSTFQLLLNGSVVSKDSSNNGVYFPVVDSGSSYTLNIVAAGYLPKSGVVIKITSNYTRISTLCTRQPLKGIDIKPDTMNMIGNSQEQLVLYAVYSDGTRMAPYESDISWTSGLPGLITVNSSGLITSGIQAGSCFLAARIASLGLSDSCLVNVIKKPFGNSSFEIPAITGFQYLPQDSAWFFAGGAGIQHNGSAFNAANAPDGVQSAFLQNVATVFQNVYFNSSSYKIKFKAAQRGDNIQTIKVYIDETELGSFTPSSANFTEFVTNPVTISEGIRQLKFAGINGVGDNTAFIDAVAIEGMGTDNEPAAIMQESLSLAAAPNPFNPSARISYYLPQKAVVSLTLYNLQGKIVKVLASGMVSSGRHTVQVEAGKLASGIYICEFRSGAAAKRLKLVLMR